MKIELKRKGHTVTAIVNDNVLLDVYNAHVAGTKVRVNYTNLNLQPREREAYITDPNGNAKTVILKGDFGYRTVGIEHISHIKAL